MDKFLSSVDKTCCAIYRIGIYPLDSLICPSNHLSQNFGELTTMPQSGFVPFYSRKNSRTFPGLRLIFPRLQISLYPFNSQDFKFQITLWSTNIFDNINSENYTVWAKQISSTLQDLWSFSRTFQVFQDLCEPWQSVTYLNEFIIN